LSQKISTTALALLFLLVSVSFVPLFDTGRASAQTSGGYLTLGYVGSPQATLGAVFNGGELLGPLSTQIPYPSYTIIGTDGVVHPSVATFAAVPNNNSEWVFNVIPGLKWSDGVPVNASDLAYSLGIFLKTGPWAGLAQVAYQGGLSDIDTITILNSSAVQFNLFKPSLEFPAAVFVYPVYPYHYFKQYDTGPNSIANTTIWGGPGFSSYVPVANYTGGSTVELVPNYYNPSWNGTKAAPALSRIYMQYFTTTSALLNALAAGTVSTAEVGYADAQSIQTYSFLKQVSVPSSGLLALNLRTVSYPYNSTDFRRGLFDLINKTAINSLIWNNTATIENAAVMIPFSTYWTQGLNLNPYSYNTSLAAQEFEAAGLHLNAQGHWALPNGTAFSITLVGTSASASYVRATQLVDQWWTAAGIQVTLSIVPDSVMINDLYGTTGAGNFEAVLSDNGFAPTPWRYLYNSANFPNGDLGLWPTTNSTFSNELTEGESAANLTAGAAYVKQALVTLANAAVIDGITTIPTFVVYNTQTYTYNPQTLVNNGLYNWATLPNWDGVNGVLTTVVPVQAGATTTSTSVADTTSTSSTTSTSPTTSTTSISPTSSTTTTTTTSSTSSSSTSLAPSALLAIGVAAAVATVALAAGRRKSDRSTSNRPF
jgi:ABC-type transport system substrate-binding protein